MSAVPEAVDPYDVTRRSNRLRRRRVTEKLMATLGIVSASLAVSILALVLGTVLFKGLSALDTDFFTQARPLFGGEGGIADALVGSALIIGMCVVFAVPVAVLVAAELAPPSAATAALVEEEQPAALAAHESVRQRLRVPAHQ